PRTPMRRLLAPLVHVLALPGIAARVGEFLYRRADVSGDIHPDDAAHGTVEGPDPDRIAVVGETGMISLGVRTHQIALPAFLARHHATRTGRGVAWSIASLPGSRLREAPAVIAGAEADLARADAVVLLAWITDVLRVTSTGAWSRQMRVAIEALRAHLPEGAWILVAGIPPLDNAGSLSRPARLAAGVHAQALNRHTRDVVDGLPLTRAVTFPEELARALWRPDGEESRYQRTYRSWGAHLSAALVDARAGAAAAGAPAG
ncbi:SGNH/GDSL hydrolase family protein, partial [Clavibacter michiganensis]